MKIIVNDGPKQRTRKTSVDIISIDSESSWRNESRSDQIDFELWRRVVVPDDGEMQSMILE